METFIRVLLLITCEMGQDFYNIFQQEKNTKAIGNVTTNMDSGYFILLMVTSIKGIGKMIKNKEKENFSSAIRQPTRATSLTITFKVMD
jgi:hypothetical protein